MTTKILSGTYTAGYTLSSAYSALLVTGAALVEGAAGAPNAIDGGDGVTLNTGTVTNQGRILGGAGFDNYAGREVGVGYGGNGGSALLVAGGGAVVNSGTMAGGAGGLGGTSTGGSGTYYWRGGVGGCGVLIYHQLSLTNDGLIAGGAGGAGRLGPSGAGNGGNGGAGVAGPLLMTGVLDNAGLIQGGAGGSGAHSYYQGITSGFGGEGVILQGTVTLDNSGTIAGGQGGAGLDGGAHGSSHAYGYSGAEGGNGGDFGNGGTLINTGVIVGGSGGAGGDTSAPTGGRGGGGGFGVFLEGAARLVNKGLIAGGAGGAGGHGARSSGGTGQAGAAIYAFVSSAATVVNYGELKGGVVFNSASDRLVAEAGSYAAACRGGGGSLELASGQGTIQGLGAGGSVTGAEEVGFSDFGSYLFDGGTSWTLVGANTIGPSQTLTNDGTLLDAGTLLNLGLVNGSAGVTLVGQGVVINGAAANPTATIGSLYAAAQSAATVTNFGVIEGSVAFLSSADRLITEAGSTIVGAAHGGGGTLELAGGSGTISGLGGAGTVSGSEGMNFSGFGHYAVDLGASFTLAGANTLGANQGVANYGTLLGSLTFGSATDHLVLGAGSVTGTVAGRGGTLRLDGGRGVLRIGANGGVTGSDRASFSGFGTYVIGAGGSWRTADFALASAQRVVSQGSLSIDQGAVRNDGLIEAQLGGRVVITSATIGGAGTIEALPTSTVYIKTSVLSGGTLATGGAGRVLLVGRGDLLDGRTSPVSLRGTINLASQATATLAGAIDLAGQLTGSHAAQLRIDGGGATLSGGGTIRLSGSSIVGESPAAVLTNSGDRITGTGDIGNGSLDLVNGAGGVIASLGAAGLTIDTGAEAIQNAGTIEANRAAVTVASVLSSSGKLEAVGATLTLEGAVTGAGSAAIFSGGAIVAEAAFSENLTFVGPTGLLSLARSQGYGGTITGFSTTGATSLDLRDIGFVSANEASFASGVLTVTDGTHTAHIHLVGNYAGASFVAASDGHGGTVVTAKAGAFADLMAGMGGSASASGLATAAPSAAASLMLAPPHG